MAKKDTVKLQKIGNSYMITLTRDIIKETGLKVGDSISMNVSGHVIKVSKSENEKDNTKLIRNLKAPKKIKHEDLMKAIKEGPYERLHLL